MGLDTVELVMAFEETFEIVIPDEAAERIVTVRDAIDYIYAQVPHSDSQVCRTQRAFHRLRSTLRAELHVDHSSVKPGTPWETLLPLEQRRDLWQRLKSVTGAPEWPALERSPSTKASIVALFLASAATAFAAATAYAATPAFALATAASASIVSSWLALRATEGRQVHFAESCTTVGQTVELLAMKMPAAWRPPGNGWTREENVRLTVRKIVTDHLNVDPNFDDDASFIDDLGAD